MNGPSARGASRALQVGPSWNLTESSGPVQETERREWGAVGVRSIDFHEERAGFVTRMASVTIRVVTLTARSSRHRPA
jgi:hypothetical protein